MNQDYLKELFSYDDGWLYWKVDKGLKRLAGKKAGSIQKITGYWRVKIDGKEYLLHRLIFLYHHGFLPEYLDHINGNPLDNRIENLRKATISQNGFNTRKYKNNKSGVKNVFWYSRAQKWIARIRVNGKNVFHQQCDTVEEAEALLKEVRHKYHGEFANDGKTKEAL